MDVELPPTFEPNSLQQFPIGSSDEIFEPANQNLDSFWIDRRVPVQVGYLLGGKAREVQRLNPWQKQSLPGRNEALGESKSLDVQISVGHFLTMAGSAHYGNADLGPIHKGTKVLLCRSKPRDFIDDFAWGEGENTIFASRIPKLDSER